MIDSYASPQLDDIFGALAHPKRRGMLDALSYRPSTIKQLADEFGLSLPAMHKHIDSLETARLIRRKKVGRVNFVALNKKTFGETKAWFGQYRTDWGNDEETLENYIAAFQD
jgi:DNA-binding transcriptional ArsR family regulator